jgi:hypothetical protein
LLSGLAALVSHKHLGKFEDLLLLVAVVVSWLMHTAGLVDLGDQIMNQAIVGFALPHFI